MFLSPAFFLASTLLVRLDEIFFFFFLVSICSWFDPLGKGHAPFKTLLSQPVTTKAHGVFSSCVCVCVSALTVLQQVRATLKAKR